ncbi:MAG: superoxide dismutase [Christensenellales bacterium]
MENMCYPFVNLPLPYAYHALEPFIDEKTMHLHHDKHLQNYIDTLNKLLKEHPPLQSLSLTQLIRLSDSLPQALRAPIKNNTGGVYNHRLFFDGLTNPATQTPHGRLARAIRCQFGSFSSLQTPSPGPRSPFLAPDMPGLWLVRAVFICTTANQNTPPGVPLLVLMFGNTPII